MNERVQKNSDKDTENRLSNGSFVINHQLKGMNKLRDENVKKIKGILM